MSNRQRKRWLPIAGVAALALSQLSLLVLFARAWLWLVTGGPFYVLGAVLVLVIAAVALVVATRIR